MSPEQGSVSFYFSLNFQNAQDISMARIMLLEFKEATRHVAGSISTQYHDKNVPSEILEVYPHVGRESYTNGIIQFSKWPSLSLTNLPALYSYE